jgi:hypothetical protein
MEQTEILEGNKLIAEFMGGKYMPYTEGMFGHFEHFMFPDLQYDENFIKINDLEYYSSWNWLMPVIEKISKIPVIGATEQSDTCYPRTFGMLQDDTGLPMFRFNCCHLYVGATLIEAAWIAVVELIKMENNF